VLSHVILLIYLQPYLHAEFPERDGDQHKAFAWEWSSLPAAEREAFFKMHGVRWFEFARLDYFDPIRMTIIDPMHNLLIGKLSWSILVQYLLDHFQVS